MLKISLFKLRGWRKPYHLFGLDFYSTCVGRTMLTSTTLQCFTLIEIVVLILSLSWVWVLNSGYIYYLTLSTVAFSEHGYEWKGTPSQPEKKLQHPVFPVDEEYSELETLHKNQVLKEKPLHTSLHQLKEIVPLSAFARHFFIATETQIEEVLSVLLPTLGFCYLGKIKPSG